ncbi:riboflavin synthase alpha chain [Nitrosomonas eutropha]|uniref:riboflavin synthase n=1 Tax=Nitrosomonas TaxID=914 RepID=UPI0008996A55|nr:MULTISPECIES: riboflavin synthase [Nitrosomonas]MXS80152.1 riboflavin synthase [Nitrosomonas sp. GH22]SDW07868.1 riboflavin synthase alpha chain [Nitrosomonas eutropha]
MFTGIIKAVGRIRHVYPKEDAVRIHIDPGKLDLTDVAIGDSIAVNGACLTLTAFEEGCFTVDVSGETLSCTHGLDIPGNPVNLEKALRFSDRLDGHLVSGHVEGVGEVVQFTQAGDRCLLAIQPPPQLFKYIIPKGSITVDGVSLTVNQVASERVEINLIPHTLANTTFKQFEPGKKVNLETDMIAKYVARLLDQAQGKQS